MKMKKLFLSGEDRYLNNLLSNNAFILQHFMKLYFYADSKELINQIWTKQYWKEELYDLFEPKTKNGKRLFDCLSTGKKARFREVLNPNKNDWKELTRIFVKGFEAVTDFPLSIRRATIPVQGHDDFGKVGTGEFTLYTGIWDEPYAVRLELWHEDSESKSEKKLTEKIYRLEGWMR